MDVDQESFSKQASSLKALIDRFDGHLNEFNRKLEEVDAVEEAQVQARQKLREKATEISIPYCGPSNPVLAVESLGQPSTEPGTYELKYVGPSEPVDITMEEVGQLQTGNTKRRRQNEDVGTAINDARAYREQLELLEGVTGGKGSPSDYDTDDYGSDTETVAALYENKGAPKDETIKQVMTLLNGLVEKVNGLLNKLPANPTPAPKSMHPIVAQHLVASGKRQPAAPEENFSPWDQTKDDERPMEPVKRPIERVAALAYVRVAFTECIGRKSRKALLPPGPPEDVQTPTRSNFWVKWNEPYNSEFNTAACKIVTRKVMEAFPTIFPEECCEDLFKMVATHLKYNIVLYRRQNLPPGDASKAKRLAASSSNRRRHTLFQNRLYIAQSVKALRPHRRLLKDLGVEGTSSDEEDPQTPGLYRVKRIKQLSSSVVQLKQKLDDTFQALVKVPGQKGNRGRKRVRTTEPSQRKFRIKGLPVNCVNRIWYNRLSVAQKGVFRFADYEYNFMFPDELLRM